jgi:hypothetical protein
MEMTGGGKPGKPKSGFSTLPTALGNRIGDFHISTASTTIPIYKVRPNPPRLRINNLGWARINRRSGPISVAKRQKAREILGKT